MAKDIEGMNMANPVSMLLSSAFMLQHLGLHSHASRIRKAVEEVVKSGKQKTLDLGGKAHTTDFTEEVVNKLKSLQ